MGLFGRITNLFRGAFSSHSTDPVENELREQALKRELEKPPEDARRKAKEELASLRGASQSAADSPLDSENKPPKKRTL